MKQLFAISLGVLLSSCNEVLEIQLPPNNIQNIFVFDIGNNLNASDLRVDFRVTDESNSEDFRIIVAKATPVNQFTISDAQGLTNDQFFSETSRSTLSYSLKLPATQLDSDGDEVVSNQEYRIYIYTPFNEALSSSSATIVLADEPVLNGDFVGTWNDNLYDNLGVSFSINAFTNRYTGDFFASTNLAPVWGSINDGRVSLLVAEDGTISNFTYNQDLPGFMDGCPGLYVGSGRVENDFTLIINFTGDDCEGAHLNGVLELTKVN